MQTIDAIQTRRSIRNWSNKEVSDDVLQQVLEAGRFAPSPLNSQAWHFTVIRNKDTISTLMEKANHGSFLSLANVVIVVTVSEEAKVDAWLSEHHQHIYSGVCAIENMWLASWDLGLGACWVTVNDPTTRELLSIPDNHKILGSLALGYADNPTKPHEEKDRRPLREMVSYEKFSG